MSGTNTGIETLIIKYLNEDISAGELKDLNDWIAESEDNQLFFQRFSDKEYISQELKRYDELKAFGQTGNNNNNWDEIVNQLPISKVVQMRFRNIKKYIAAASVVIILAGGYLIGQRWHSKNSNETAVKKGQDIQAGGNKAILTLADGSTIILDSSAHGILAQQGNTKIINLGGQLAYNAGSSVLPAASDKVLYNVITTPKGGQYQLLLPDGSKVWLDAMSSLKYPINFNGKERSVELKGEGYFEIAANNKQPFSVKVEGVQVKVLGTQFNIMAYKEERVIKTTLLKGSVKIMSGNNASLLKPAQQAQVSENGKIKILEDVNTEAEVSWMNGSFHFVNADLGTIMRQIGRWYDMEIEFKGDTSEKFYGEISRSKKLSQVLNLLEKSGVSFEVKNRTITVIP